MNTMGRDGRRPHRSPAPHILARLQGLAGVVLDEHEQNAGELLSDALLRAPLPLEILLDTACHLARTLAAIHGCGVVLGNLHPGQILLAEDGLPRLLDLGHATTLAQRQPGFTHHSAIAGELGFLAPEQTGRTGATVDHRADLYALGATFYAMATGCPPFQSDDPLQLIRDQLARLPTAPSQLRPGLPRLLSEAILRLLQKEPDKRYQSADGLAHDLERLKRAVASGDQEPWPLGMHDFPVRLTAPSRLVGREREVETLHRILEEAVAGEGRVVLVSGAPGVGKTSLINELRPLVTAHRGWFVSGKFDQYNSDAPSAPVQAFQALARLLLAEPEADLREVCARMREGLDHHGSLAPPVPEFAALLGPPDSAEVDPVQAAARYRWGAVDVLRAVVSMPRPLVFVLEDLQWAHDADVRLLELLLSAPRLRGLLVVGTYRESEVDAAHPLAGALAQWERGPRPPVLLRLPNLPAPQMAELLGGMLRLPAERAGALAAALAPHTAGNPYDTVELVNALRRDALLVPDAAGWHWDSAAVARYVGDSNVLDLLAARLARLPRPTQDLLQAQACLGTEVPVSLLAAATGVLEDEVLQRLQPALEDGLLLAEPGDDPVLRLRHDRVQQAAYGSLGPEQRLALHLALARGLARAPKLASAAAEQYLAAAAAVADPAECVRAAALLRAAAAHAHDAANHPASERLLATALDLLQRASAQDSSHDELRGSMEAEYHEALYALGRLDEADAVYERVRRHEHGALDFVDAACVQIASLFNRSRHPEAVELALARLARLGIHLEDRAQPALTLQETQGPEALARDLVRAEATQPEVIAAARLINWGVGSAFFSDRAVSTALLIAGRRLWVQHGPCAALLPCFIAAPVPGVGGRESYLSTQHGLAVGKARGYASETAWLRYNLAVHHQHWFEPLEAVREEAHAARAASLRGGDLQTACFSYHPLVIALLDCAAVSATSEGIDAGLVLAERTQNRLTISNLVSFRQLMRSLRGETRAPGGFDQDGFDEAAHLRRVRNNPLALGYFHLTHALCAAVFSDADGLAAHAAAMDKPVQIIRGAYAYALARLLQGLALAWRLQQEGGRRTEAELAQIDAHADWLQRRAEDAPVNFAHLALWLRAERAWAGSDLGQAAQLFDAALRECEDRARPWHRALITERCASLYLAQGLSRPGRLLLAQARDRYREWGAAGKVRELERVHGLAPAAVPAAHHDAAPGIDSIDVLALLRASQALSSETSVARLTARLAELLGTLAGASEVGFAWYDAQAQQWLAADPLTHDAIPLAEAGDRGLLPLAAFRYAERTREPLVVHDVAGDARFATDPYYEDRAAASLLVVPIQHQGALRAMLVLENRLSRGAFTTARLDAVMLIAGQLAVSLENALLYQQLEARVAERTTQLKAAQSELLATARRAGMAEIANNVLHNVGNVLNTVNVSANLISARLRTSRSGRLDDLARMLQQREHELASFLTSDEQGKLLPHYIDSLAQALAAEREEVLAELRHLTASVDDIKSIVATQQLYAGASTVLEPARMTELVEDALRIDANRFARRRITVIKEFQEVAETPLDRARVMQILVNLVANAGEAMQEVAGEPRLWIAVQQQEGRLRVTVRDNGCGIAPENLTRVFSHGFTTKKDGHGFGLHSCALAAEELGGTLTAASDGPGQGAIFTLELPLDQIQTGDSPKRTAATTRRGHLEAP